MGKKKQKKKEVDEEYHVEVITKARVSDQPGVAWEYLVKWAGYSSEDDTWEPMGNLKSCERLLQSFWLHIGLDNEDYRPGYQVEAKPEWIIQERQYYATEIARKEKQKQKPKKSINMQSSSSTSSSKMKEKTAVNNMTSDSESGDEPLAIKARLYNKRPILDDKSTTLSEKKSKIDPPPTSTTSTALTFNKGKQKETIAISPTSLFSEPSSPEIVPAALPSSKRTQSGSGQSRTPSISQVPNRQERQTLSRIKAFPLEPRQIAGGSGLSTKQRLAQSTAVETSSKLKLAPPSTLKSLSFKKNPSPPTSNVREMDPKSSAQLTSSQVEDRCFSADVPEIAASPNSMTTHDYIPLMEHDPFDSYSPFPVQERLQTSDPLNPLTDAEEFLQSVMPKELAAPLTPQPFPPRNFVPSKTSLLPKIPKKWKWTGKLLIDTAGEKLEQLCDIALTDATEHLAEGLRLSVVFSSMDSIRFSKLHNVSDLDIVLRACKPVHQLAKLGPQDGKDPDALGKLVRYMDKRRQVTFVPVSLDNAVVGILLVFPATMHELYRRFKVPGHLQQIGVFVSALLPWALSVAKRREDVRIPYCADIVPFNTLGSDRREFTLKRHPNYHRAIQILQFPGWLHDYMSKPDRPYCVWSTPVDGTWKEPGMETELLRCVLKQCKTKDVGHKADVRAVFVHVGALKSLYRLPALAERRSKRPEIGFFTYGTHEDVSPDRWGIRAIFRLGGIVTFTPSSLIEDPIGVYQLMGRLAKHCLWECYILPSTIGMAAKLTSADQDPLILQEKGVSICDLILAMIEEGEVSLIRAPPTRCSHLRDNDPMSRWVGQQAKQQGLNSRGLLEACMKAFDEEYSDIQESEWFSAIESDICGDMLSMQCQSALIDNYRRYVVIKARQDDHIPWDRSGLEWLPLSNFSFKDDYFK